MSKVKRHDGLRPSTPIGASGPSHSLNEWEWVWEWGTSTSDTARDARDPNAVAGGAWEPTARETPNDCNPTTQRQEHVATITLAIKRRMKGVANVQDKGEVGAY